MFLFNYIIIMPLNLQFKDRIEKENMTCVDKATFTKNVVFTTENPRITEFLPWAGGGGPWLKSSKI
jgi:hypothetical protein